MRTYMYSQAVSKIVSVLFLYLSVSLYLYLHVYAFSPLAINTLRLISFPSPPAL